MLSRALLMILFAVLPFSMQASGDSGEDAGETEAGLLDLIQGLAEGAERAWAKPIEEVDMERMRELLDLGLVTFHEADWYVEAEENE